MKVNPIPLFTDNYCYLIHGSAKDKSFLVDPADEKAVHDWLKKHPEYTISHILVTHRHWDHAQGVPGLAERLKKDYQHSGKNSHIEIVVGAAEKQPYATKNVGSAGSFEVNDIRITHIPVPCHTIGHQLYYLEDLNHLETKNDPQEPKNLYRAVFTGDTLFIGGVGKFFEGGPTEMQKNFDEIRKLPKDTFVFCGHEYTLDNFKWAMGIYPENETVKKRYNWAKEMRAKGFYTVPSTVGDEIESNVFMMTRDQTLQKKFGVTNEIKLMEKLREWKDKKKTFSSEL